LDGRLTPALRARPPHLELMATRKINLQLDDELVRRVRQQAIAAVGKSDAEVIEDALTVYLGDRALDAGVVDLPDPDEAGA
jgi:ribbon-helix-helix CopG family protein